MKLLFILALAVPIFVVFISHTRSEAQGISLMKMKEFRPKRETNNESDNDMWDMTLLINSFSRFFLSGELCGLFYLKHFAISLILFLSLN